MRLRDLERILTVEGWVLTRITGSHNIFRKEGRSCIAVSAHGGDVRADVFRDVLRQVIRREEVAMVAAMTEVAPKIKNGSRSSADSGPGTTTRSRASTTASGDTNTTSGDTHTKGSIAASGWIDRSPVILASLDGDAGAYDRLLQEMAEELEEFRETAVQDLQSNVVEAGRMLMEGKFKDARRHAEKALRKIDPTYVLVGTEGATRTRGSKINSTVLNTKTFDAVCSSPQSQKPTIVNNSVGGSGTDGRNAVQAKNTNVADGGKAENGHIVNQSNSKKPNKRRKKIALKSQKAVASVLATEKCDPLEFDLDFCVLMSLVGSAIHKCSLGSENQRSMLTYALEKLQQMKRRPYWRTTQQRAEWLDVCAKGNFANTNTNSDTPRKTHGNADDTDDNDNENEGNNRNDNHRINGSGVKKSTPSPRSGGRQTSADDLEGNFIRYVFGEINSQIGRRVDLHIHTNKVVTTRDPSGETQKEDEDGE
jgi:predicted RNA binding protein YcfA (HicA-like mRNA interferase family)